MKHNRHAITLDAVIAIVAVTILVGLGPAIHATRAFSLTPTPKSSSVTKAAVPTLDAKHVGEQGENLRAIQRRFQDDNSLEEQAATLPE